MNVVDLSAALVLPAFAVGIAAAGTDATFKPIHVQRTGGFQLPIPPAKAIRLFTGPGEKL